jgi:endonuclease/exonuclease/phosphatase family metal-dependent hydrolase
MISSDTEDLQPSHSLITFYHPVADIRKKAIIESKTNNNVILDRKNIRVLTYNIFLRPPGIKNNESDHKNDRMNDFFKMMHNYDIICIQELFGSMNNRKDIIIRAATKNGFFYYVEDKEPGFFSKYISDGGLLIISRFPIVKYSLHPFKYGVISDAIAQKAVIYAKILVGNSFVHIFNTHTQASYNNEIYDLFLISYQTRMDQLKQAAEFIKDVMDKEYSKESDIALFCGDLNVDSLQYHKINIKHSLTSDFVKNEYEEMISLFVKNNLDITNLFYEHHGYYPITYGEVCPETGYFDKVLTHRDDLGICQNLDYIFEIKPNNILSADTLNGKDSNQSPSTSRLKNLNQCNSSCFKNLSIIDKSSRVVKHLINEMDFDSFTRTYTQLSDHYGLSVLLSYKENLLNNSKNEVKETLLLVEISDDEDEEEKVILIK